MASPKEVELMSDLFMVSKAQMRRIEPYFPLSHRVPRVDDRRVLSRIVFVIRNGLRWRDAPCEYGPHKTIYNPVLSPSKGGSCAGAVWVCSTRFSQAWLPAAMPMMC